MNFTVDLVERMEHTSEDLVLLTTGIHINTTEIQESATSDIWYHIWWMDFIRVIFSVLVPLCGVVGNLLVILTVCKAYVKQILPHYLIANLAVTDFIFSLQNVVFSPALIALR